jgi:hypothetical protein
MAEFSWSAHRATHAADRIRPHWKTCEIPRALGEVKSPDFPAKSPDLLLNIPIEPPPANIWPK